MFTSTVLPASMWRYSELASSLFQKCLMLAGVFFVLALVGVQSGNPTMLGGLKSLMPASEEVAGDGELDVVADGPRPVGVALLVELVAPLRGRKQAR